MAQPRTGLVKRRRSCEAEIVMDSETQKVERDMTPSPDCDRVFIQTGFWKPIVSEWSAIRAPDKVPRTRLKSRNYSRVAHQIDFVLIRARWLPSCSRGLQGTALPRWYHSARHLGVPGLSRLQRLTLVRGSACQPRCYRCQVTKPLVGLSRATCFDVRRFLGRVSLTDRPESWTIRGRA